MLEFLLGYRLFPSQLAPGMVYENICCQFCALSKTVTTLSIHNIWMDFLPVPTEADKLDGRKFPLSSSEKNTEKKIHFFSDRIGIVISAATC